MDVRLARKHIPVVPVIALAIAVVAGMLVVSARPARAGSEPEMTVLWFERPPLYSMEDGHPAGRLLELADRVLRRAGLRPVYIEMPHRRVLQTLRDAGQANLVGVGWFRTPEREVWLRYSRPIARESAMGILIRREDRDRFLAFATFADLAVFPDLIPGRIAGYSYGVTMDETFRERTGRIVDANQDAQLFALLAAGRCDYMPGPETTLTPLILEAGLDPEDFSFIHYPDLSGGGRRYLIFSRETSQETVDRINAAILGLAGDLR